jgi:hypothetical protein
LTQTNENWSEQLTISPKLYQFLRRPSKAGHELLEELIRDQFCPVEIHDSADLSTKLRNEVDGKLSDIRVKTQLCWA